MTRAQAQVTPVAGGDAGQRRIALVEPAATAGDERVQHAMRLLDTMLWVLKGTTRDAWATATPDEADIVVVHRGEDLARTAGWRARGKLIVEIAQAGDSAGDNVLCYPFPAKRVLELLEKLSAQLDARVAPPVRAPARATEAPRPPVANADRWALLEAIRTVRTVRNDNLWLVARDGADPVLWLRGDGSAYFATENFVRALRTDSMLNSRLELRDGYPPPKTRVVERPGAEFFWFAAFNAGENLAPWLDASQRCQVTAWPDFGLVRPDSAVLRAVALLASQPLDVATLAARARIPTALANRIFNALSLTEVLVTVGTRADKKGAGNIQQPRGGFSGFLRRLRTHLGIGVEA